MKQKLPEKKSSYNNFYLGERQENEILSNSLTKYSLSRLLIAIFFDLIFEWLLYHVIYLIQEIKKFW